MEAMQSYLAAIEANLNHGLAGEHSHRGALETLLNAVCEGCHAVNEPKRVECGAPDFVVLENFLPVGHVECKDVGIDLNKVEKSPQLKRYLKALPNLILTDYLEFRWFVSGKVKMTVSIGSWSGKHLVPNTAGIAQLVTMLRQFAETRTPTIRTARQLAILLAGKARLLDDLVQQAFQSESAKGELHEQLTSIRTLLVPDMAEDAFADMYAQTVAYGLFAARIFDPTPESFSRFEAEKLLPPTNPLLRAFFKHLGSYELEQDAGVVWCIDEMCNLFLHVDIHKVLEDFSRRKGFEDPIVHFYETFLAEYDPKLKKSRGVYYTPEPVVSFIVRSVDQILKDKFGKPDGLANKSVMVLDPATGTATFLRAVIEMVHQYFVDKGQEGMWDAYVPEYVLKRIFGFELLMAPYAVAHLKLGEQLKETGYKFESGERLGIYLTNTLEEAAKKSESLLGLAKLISEESDQASHIKREEPIMVVLGNPPYANFGKQNKSKWILKLLKEYKRDLKEKKININDDFIKFIRFGQWRIDQTGQGILAFITNNTFIDGITHRRMRESLMETFTDIYILDLHGSAKKKEKCPDGSKDENVFDIQQGVSINLFVKELGKENPANIHHSELWGLREKKYKRLETDDISNLEWQELKTRPEQFFFVPKDFALEAEYETFISLKEAFPISGSGIKTERDRVSIHWTKQKIELAISDFRILNEGELRIQYNLGKDSRDWKVAKAKADVFANHREGLFRQIFYRPFDPRWTWYSGQTRGFIGTPGFPTMRHLLEENVSLLSVRQLSGNKWHHILVGQGISECCCVSNKTREITSAFPLYTYPPEISGQGDLLAAKEKEPNLAPAFIEALSEKLGLMFDAGCHRGLHTNGDGVTAVYEIRPDSGFGVVELDNGKMVPSWNPEDLFCYAYAVFYSPTYRTRYAEFLKIDFPRLPLTSDPKLFFRLADLGEELVGLHLMRSPKLNDFITGFPHSGGNEVEKPRYENGSVWLNKSQCFSGVEEEDWNFHIGGYQVLGKWLKDRKGRKLSFDDIEHYQKIVVAIHETRRLMSEIDAAIPTWPMN